MSASSKVTTHTLPDDALLGVYARSEGCYTDCYAVGVSGEIDLVRYVSAFYTTPLFKLERAILKYAVSRPSTDDEARKIAAGATDRFAAWTMEQRSDDQLLMCDMAGRTRSWFMVEPDGDITQLYFGSAVVSVTNGKTGRKELGFVFLALLGFHKLYSRALLASAASRLGN